MEHPFGWVCCHRPELVRDKRHLVHRSRGCRSDALVASVFGCGTEGLSRFAV